MRRFPDIALASVRISLPENKENQHREEPDYGVSQDKILLFAKGYQIKFNNFIIYIKMKVFIRRWRSNGSSFRSIISLGP